MLRSLRSAHSRLYVIVFWLRLRLLAASVSLRLRLTLYLSRIEECVHFSLEDARVLSKPKPKLGCKLKLRLRLRLRLRLS